MSLNMPLKNPWTYAVIFLCPLYLKGTVLQSLLFIVQNGRLRSYVCFLWCIMTSANDEAGLPLHLISKSMTVGHLRTTAASKGHTAATLGASKE